MQALAKIFIHTNPKLVPPEHLFDSVSCLISLISEDSKHQLLVYEGLLALTNISSCDQSIREKIVSFGVWPLLSDLLRHQESKESAATD
jgi:hypothetical protein